MYLVNSPSQRAGDAGSTPAPSSGRWRAPPASSTAARSLAGDVAAAVLGRSTIAPHKGDRRFADPAWASHPVYRRLGQAYLAVERAIG